MVRVEERLIHSRSLSLHCRFGGDNAYGELIMDYRVFSNILGFYTWCQYQLPELFPTGLNGTRLLLGSLRQENHEFEARPGYIKTSSQRKQ